MQISAPITDTNDECVMAQLATERKTKLIWIKNSF